MSVGRQMPAVSAIVVVGKRQDDLDSIARDYWNALERLNQPFELLFVLDGRHDPALKALGALRDAGIPLKIIRLSRAFGEATALMCGLLSSPAKRTRQADRGSRNK